MSQHIIIVGAGIIGLSTAYAIITRAPHLRLTLVESGDQAGHGASWANGSMIHPSQATPWREAGVCDDRVSKASYILAARSAQILQERFKNFGLKSRHVCQGTFKIYPDRAALDADMKKLLPLMELGLRAQFLSAQQTLTRVNGLSGPLAGAVHFPDDFSGPARLYCRALIKRLLAAGVNLKTRCDVERIDAENIITASGEQ